MKYNLCNSAFPHPVLCD